MTQIDKKSENTSLLSVVIPTRNEASNINPLLDRINGSLYSVSSEIIFVDDSDDDTRQAIQEAKSLINVALIMRDDEQRIGGLATAVVAGLAEASGKYVCVMDADLQHPPETIPAMLESIQNADCDIVIASRYVENAQNKGLTTSYRKLVSESSIKIAQVLFPKIRDIKDPNAGFFLLNREILNGVALNPIGYKVLLEILIKTDWSCVKEFPYTFAERYSGESKATLKQGVQFYQHLLRLLLAEKRMKKNKKNAPK